MSLTHDIPHNKLEPPSGQIGKPEAVEKMKFVDSIERELKELIRQNYYEQLEAE